MSDQNHIMDTPLGLIAIGATEHAITAVHFMRQEEMAMSKKNITNPLTLNCITQLQEYFEGKRKVFDLPLEQKGSAFQQNVWNQLLKIEYGKTISYLELSKRIGDVKAIRAVGATNGKNQIAIIVPCHRVVGSDGSLTGYAGELWRKKWLLEHEGRFANGVQTLF